MSNKRRHPPACRKMTYRAECNALRYGPTAKIRSGKRCVWCELNQKCT